MEIIDAHIHLPVNKSNDPVALFLSEVENACLKGYVLVVNTDQEKTLFFENKKRLDDFAIPYALSFLVSPKEKKTVSDYKTIQISKAVERLSLKIHPRFSDLSKSDFFDIANILTDLQPKVVIIDAFIYGHMLRNHIGVKLTIYLAEKFPEISFVVAHSGVPYLLETQLLLSTLPNVFQDLSCSCNYFLGTSIRPDMANLTRFRHKRLLFGSDYPEFTPTEAIGAMEILCAEVNSGDNNKRNIFFNNALNIYFEESFSNERKNH